MEKNFKTISSLQSEMQIDFWRVHEESSLLAFSLVTCEAVTLLNLFFTQNSMHFPYCWPLTVLQGWEVLKGRLFLAVISVAAGICWAWAFRTIIQGKGSQICFWMLRLSWEQFPRQPSQFVPAFRGRCLYEGASCLPDSTQVLCSCSHGFLSVPGLALSFSLNCFVPRRPSCSLCFPLLC